MARNPSILYILVMSISSLDHNIYRVAPHPIGDKSRSIYRLTYTAPASLAYENL